MRLKITNELKIISKRGLNPSSVEVPMVGTNSSDGTRTKVEPHLHEGVWRLHATRLGEPIDTAPRPPPFRQSQITKQQSKRDVLHEALRGAPRISRGIYP
jgi:hypothetical protein